MRVFGFEISRTKASLPAATPTQPLDRGNWWYPVIREPFTGGWQRNMEIRPESALTYSAVYACVTLIASDVGKLGLRLVEEDSNGIWSPAESPSFSPVLRKPNRYQTRIKFIENWVTSKLINGNAFILKQRDNRNVVVDMYVLDPMRVRVLVAPDGEVYYELQTDNLAGIKEQVSVPASEIIHDTMVALYHPLCGVSPISACALAAWQGIQIQRNSSAFFQNGSSPGGIITAPGRISDEQAKRIKDYWELNYTGENTGKIAVLGDGLAFTTIAVKAVDAQLIEQLKWTAETVCMAFHVPPYKIGVGQLPALNNVEALNQEYYAQCLQTHIESIELLLDEGLALGDVKDHTYGTEFDLDDLLRMDTSTKAKVWSDLVKGVIASPNEARLRFNLPPVKGGKSPIAQQQNYSIEALAKRDAKDDPFATTPAPQADPPKPPADNENDLPADELKALAALFGNEVRLRLTNPGHFA